MFKKYKLIFICLVLSALMSHCSDDNSNEGDNFQVVHRQWTIMYYSDADCDLETDLLLDVSEMKTGYVDSDELNLILLIDRHPASEGYRNYTDDATVLGEDFAEARLYKITHRKATRISGRAEFPEITASSGSEVNMGSAATLKKFIKFCKANYPADYYALFLSNHGDGPSKKKAITLYPSKKTKAIAFDKTDGNDNNAIYTGEMTEVLTADESVNIIGYDACLMGGVELVYQFRTGSGGFTADYLIANPPEEWGEGWPYDDILARITSETNTVLELDTFSDETYEKNYDPATMTPEQFAHVIIEEHYDAASAAGSGGRRESMGVYDSSQAAIVKTALDELATLIALETNGKDLLESIRGEGSSPNTLYYFTNGDPEDWLCYPFFDLYDLAERIKNNYSFTAEIRSKAGDLMTAVDQLVVYSYGNSTFKYMGYQNEFQKGKNGIYLFFPDGDRLYNNKGNYVSMYSLQYWYTSRDLSHLEDSDGAYGNISFCSYDNDGQVESWLELLEKWYDPNDESPWATYKKQ